MIELPEAVTIARQISRELKGKRIQRAVRGNAPHKFAFYTRSPEEYVEILAGKVMGDATDHGACLMAFVEPNYAIELGGGGGRILFHASEATLPKKHQLLVSFTDGTHLSVTVQGWGSVKLLLRSEIGDPGRVRPLSEDFTFDHFDSLFADLAEGDPRSVKYFVISQPGVWGIGNGYLQDILFTAKLHPRRRAATLDAPERHALHDAIRSTLMEAVSRGGRDTERDLHGNAGGHVPILDRRAKGAPCPRCETPIEAISFLGGRSYFCPRCQV